MNQKSAVKLFFTLHLVCIIIIIVMIGYTFYSITKMPETIPIHTSNGVIDGWGSKWISLIMPGLVAFIYILSTLFIRYQKRHNQSTILTNWVRFGCVILFSIVNLSFIEFALA